MNTEIIETVNLLADKLGTTADKLIEMFVPHVIASSIVWSVAGIFIIIVASIVAIMIIKDTRDTEVKVFAIALFCFTVFIGAMFLAENVPDIVAPEAAAFQKIVRTIKY